MTNSPQMVDTSDEWIVQRTGIRERHIAADGEFTSDLGIAAARAALAACRHGRRRISISSSCATSTPDNTFPATRGRDPGRARHHITAPLSIFRRSARASSTRWRPRTDCSSRGVHKRALVIGAETFSRILDWTDRGTCVLFGDGAGAVVMEAQQQARHATTIAAC